MSNQNISQYLAEGFAMLFCGIQKVTLIDYPGEVASILFFPGCNLRCPYCQNPNLVTPPFPEEMVPIEEAFGFLRKRRAVLGAVVISGGEPLLHPEMPEVARHIQSLGLKVKLDTNGTMPSAMRSMQPDYIAMDIKTSLRKYAALGWTMAYDIKVRIMESVELIKASGIRHEWRTVAVPGIVELEDIESICSLIGEGEELYISQFKPETTLDESFGMISPYPRAILDEMKSIAEKAGIKCSIRDWG